MSWGDENTVFQVVINDEEQYSIWPDYKAVPAGWRTVGQSGRKDECLAWIDEVWTDMRPLSLRRAMAEAEAGGNANVDTNVNTGASAA
jgi:MbtH protein